MEVVKGSTFQIEATVYSYWGGTVETSQPADLTGADVRCMVKRRVTDTDADAIIDRAAEITEPAAGKCIVQFNAADTNDLSYAKLYYDIVAKLSDSTVIRIEASVLQLVSNVRKTLY